MTFSEEEVAASKTLVKVRISPGHTLNPNDAVAYNVSCDPIPGGDEYEITGQVDDLDSYFDDITIGDKDVQADFWSKSDPPTEPAYTWDDDEDEWVANR